MPDTQVERKRLPKPFQFKAAEDAPGKIVGHGAVFDEAHPTSSWSLPSDYLDIIRPGAFKKTLADFKRRGVLPAMFLDHRLWEMPIGAWSSMAEDEDGLACEGTFATKTQRGSDAYELAKIGALSGLSIGFNTVKSKIDDKAKTRELLELELIEVSPTVMPAIDSARISDVKSARGAAELKRALEDYLRDAGGMSREEAKRFVSAGWKELNPDGRRDAGSAGGEGNSADTIAAMRGITDTIRRSA